MEKRGYQDYAWEEIIERGGLERLKVIELNLYLREHALTTVGRKPDKVKAIRCHFYRKKSSTSATHQLSGDDESSNDQSDSSSDTDFSIDDESCSDDDLVIADLSSSSPVITFISDEQIASVVQGP